MPTYVVLWKLTDQGIRTMKDLDPVAMVEQNRAGLLEQAGGRLIGTWWTQGAYDAVSVFEAPDDEFVATGMIRRGMQGRVRSETLRAFTAEEMQRILQKLL